MLHDEFPRLHRPSLQSREVMRMLRYRQKLIKMRTMSKNSLQSLAPQSGIARRGRLFTREGKAELDAAVMSPAMEWQRAHWLQLLEPLNQQWLEAMTWLKAASQNDVSSCSLPCVWCTHCSRWRAFAIRARWPPMPASIPWNALPRSANTSLGLAKPVHVFCVTCWSKQPTSPSKDEDLKRFYQHLAHRRGRPKAKVAAARKLLIRAYIMMRDEIDYAEFRRRAVAARLARLRQGPQVPAALIGAASLY
jgi:hypothetical protein